MSVKIVRDGQVIHDDSKSKVIESDTLLSEIIKRQELLIHDLQNQIKDLKTDLKFYRKHS
jgi:NhaP-type Na+/H+ and K+/H+ antiporter